MKRTSAQLVLSLIVISLLASGIMSFSLYETFDFILPIRAGGVWGLAIGSVFAWTLFFSLRHRFPIVIKSKEEVRVLRAKHPLPQLIAARISVVALALIVAPSMIASVYGAGITIAAFEYLNAFLAIKGSYVTII